jgi:hypothetical protein
VKWPFPSPCRCRAAPIRLRVGKPAADAARLRKSQIAGHERHQYDSVEDFWPTYIAEHSRPLTRWLHFIGTTNMAIWILVALTRRRPWLLLPGLISSYAFAWTGHFLVERNRPATFRHPVLASLGDLTMYGRMLRGELWRGRTDVAPTDQPHS